MTDRPPRAEVGLKSLVARVNSKTQLVLNVGQVNGVKPGDIFRIVSEEGVPINDPNTGEPIGLLPVEKGRVRVQTVYPKICVAETYRTYTVGGGAALAGIFGPEREVTEEMSVEQSEPDDVDRTVRVGDTATLVTLARVN
jgi:hypothetical protein